MQDYWCRLDRASHNDLTLHLCPEKGFDDVRHYAEQQFVARKPPEF